MRLLLARPGEGGGPPGALGAAGADLRSIGVLLGASLAALVCQYLFHLWVGRSLGPQDYGAFAALFALLAVVGMPVDAARAAVADRVARHKALVQEVEIATLLRAVSLKALLFGGAFFAAYLLASQPIAQWLRIPSVAPVAALGATLFLFFPIPVVLGGLQGLQRFGHLALNTFLTGALRLGVGVGLLSLGFGLTGAVATTGIVALITLAIAALPLAPLWVRPGRPSRLPHQAVQGYDGFIFLTLLCLAVLISADVLLVKHFFAPAEAGYYAAAALLARVGLHGAVAVATVIFPRACEEDIGSADLGVGKRVLGLSLLMALGLSAGSALVLFVVPLPLVTALLGSTYAPSASLAGPLAVAVVPASLAYVLAYYNLGRRHRPAVYSLAACAALEILLLALFHESLMQVVVVVGLVSFLGFASNQYFALAPKNG